MLLRCAPPHNAAETKQFSLVKGYYMVQHCQAGKKPNPKPHTPRCVKSSSLKTVKEHTYNAAQRDTQAPNTHRIHLMPCTSSHRLFSFPGAKLSSCLPKVSACLLISKYHHTCFQKQETVWPYLAQRSVQQASSSGWRKAASWRKQIDHK